MKFRIWYANGPHIVLEYPSWSALGDWLDKTGDIGVLRIDVLERNN